MKTFGVTGKKSYSEKNINKYVLFRVGSNIYCISVDFVQEMIILPQLMHMPNLPKHFIGIFEFRNVIVPVMSLRNKFNLKTEEEENRDLVELLRALKQDHLDWLEELYKSVVERRPFRLTTDPTKCKFGLWYYSFKTDNIILQTILSDFEEPHRKIHHLAIEVEEYKKTSQFDKAVELIEKQRDGVLRTLIDLFDSVEKLLLQENKKIAIVLRKENFTIAIQVDKLISVSEVNFNLDDSDVRQIENAQYAKRIGREIKSKIIAIELDLDDLLAQIIQNPILT